MYAGKTPKLNSHEGNRCVDEKNARQSTGISSEKQDRLAVRRRKRRRAFRIGGEIVPRGSLEDNVHHPRKVIVQKKRRDAFLEELAKALSEMPADSAKT